MSPALLITLLILAASIILFLSDRLRPDLIALLVLISLGLTSVLTPQEAFSGFSRSAVIIIMSVFVLAEGLRRTGVTEQLGRALLHLAGSKEKNLIFAVMLAGGTLSLFMNNIAAASVLLPAVSGVARTSKVNPSRLLMPLAFGTILGGMATLFTTANIVVSSLLRDHGIMGYGVFDFAPLGLPILGAGIIYMMLVGRRLLPTQSPAQRLSEIYPTDLELLDIYHLGERLIRGSVFPGSQLAGVLVSDSCLRESFNLNVLAIEREARVILSPPPEMIFQVGDVLLLMGRPEEIQPTEIASLLELLPLGEWKTDYLNTSDAIIVEAILAPRSTMIGETLRDVLFRDKYGMNVLAIWRAGRPIRTAVSDLPLQFGDALLLEGSPEQLKVLRTEPELIVLSNGGTPPSRKSRKAWLAVGIMAAVILAAAFELRPLAEVMLGGALLMILSGILSMDDAYRAIEWKTVFLVAGILPLGIAITKTGVATLVSNWVTSFLGASGAWAVLAGLVAITVAFVQMMNSTAVATFIAPIAIQTAHNLNANPRSLAMGITLAASMAFITPLGHPVNILVMGSGGYKFRDYVRVGLPLAILSIVILLMLLPVFWPLYPS